MTLKSQIKKATSYNIPIDNSINILLTWTNRAKKENMKPVAKDIDLSVAPPSRIASRSNQSRKSEVVKTIERIDDERKIRRENQSRIRHQRDQIRSKHDVNDAQWEFSEM